MTAGELYIVPTPLGHLEDMTHRAIHAIKNADWIAAEDTRRTRILLANFGFHKTLLSYFEGNKSRRIPQIMSALHEGKRVVLVSSAGTPCISDPGADLVHAARQEGVRVTPLPGPTAVTLLLSATGWRLDGFTFLGFLPRKKGKALREIRQAAALNKVFVIFESPYRILKTLALLAENFPQSTIFLGREMTKIHEEYLLGDPRSILQKLESRDKILGELTLAVRPHS